MTTPDPRHLSFARQLALLSEVQTAEDGHPPTIADIARATQLSEQTLLNLLHGRADNPRLETLRAICAFFGVPMDYFACETEAACRAYLYQQRLQTASPLVQQILHETTALSARGQRNILTALEWMSAAPHGNSS